MKIELILLGVIGVVFLADFLLKGIKRKDKSAESNELSVDSVTPINTDTKTSKINWLKRFLISFILGLFLGFFIDYFFNYKLLFEYIFNDLYLENYSQINILYNLLIGQGISFTIVIIFPYLLNHFSLDSNHLSPFWEYLFKRKKNLILSTVGVLFLKVILHYLFYPIIIKRVSGAVVVKKYRRRGFGGEAEVTGESLRNTYEEVNASFGEHIVSSKTGDLVIFNQELTLYLPSIAILIFIAWYFNDKIKAR